MTAAPHGQRLDFTTPLDHGDDREPPEQDVMHTCAGCGQRGWFTDYCGDCSSSHLWWPEYDDQRDYAEEAYNQWLLETGGEE